MALEPDVEERDVSKDEIKAGVQLRAGHQVVLIIGGTGHPVTVWVDGNAARQAGKVFGGAHRIRQGLARDFEIAVAVHFSDGFDGLD